MPDVLFAWDKRYTITIFNPVFFTFEQKKDIFPAQMKSLDKPKNKFAKEDKFIADIKEMLFLGIIWYKLKYGQGWPEISDIMEKNGHKYGIQGLSAIKYNWAAQKIGYFFRLYEVLGIPWPTPKLLVEWEEEIKQLQQERKERISRQKAEKAERIARNKVL